ncbi:MAG: HsdM family class I SAM-dependent methyltransferase [Bacteroidota bacterium]
MQPTIGIKDLNFWKANLGLLPVPLFLEANTPSKFIMLNGSYGNFCLDFSEKNGNERNTAWSSNVDHYVNISPDKVSVQRWDKYSPTTYSINSVKDKIHDFYTFLQKDKAESNLNIVSFSLNVFRQLRAILRDENGNNTVNAFLFLLAYDAENCSNRKDLDLKKWSLNLNSSEIVNSIRDRDWESIIEMLHQGLPTIDLIPNSNLILRHAAGSLFQEAHFETNYPVEYQITLEGFLPSYGAGLKKISPSSSHYTPTSIVRTIVEEILSKHETLPKKLKILDPACGSGEFLREIIRQLSIKNYKGEITVIGWDISQSAIDMAKFILAFEKIQSSATLKIDIINQNALAEDTSWPTDIDIILMNPPFISWELLKKDEREILEKGLGKMFEGKPNLASAFLWKAFKTIKKDGYLGLILPSSILEGDSYYKLRKELEANLSVILLGKLGSLNLFSNALVDASIFISKKGEINEKPINLWCDYNVESSSKALRSLRISKLTKSNQPVFDSSFSIFNNAALGKDEHWIPVSYKSWKVLESVKKCRKVKELFEIKQGVRTGMNAAFLVEKKYVLNLKKEERVFFRPAITNESINQGKLSDEIYIFYPYGDGISEINNEKTLEKYVPAYFKDYIKPNSVQLKSRARRTPDNWWKLSEHRAWQVVKSPKIITKEFGKAGSLAYDKKGNFVVERGHVWLPRDMNKWLANENIGYGYVAVFSMSIIDDLLNALSKQIGGGQWYLASKFIDHMPIPDLFDKRFDVALLDELAYFGLALSKGETIDFNRLNHLTQQTFKRY